MNQYLQRIIRKSSEVSSVHPFLIEIKNKAGKFFYYGLFASAFDAHINAIDRVELPAKIYVKKI